MKIRNIPGSYKQKSRDLKFVALLFVAAFLMLLSTSSALGQGFKMTQLNVPGAQTGTTGPFGVNTSQDVVGAYKNASGDTVGFLYSAGKYTNISPPDADGYARAEGINDSDIITGNYLDSGGRYHGFIYSKGTYTTYDETKTESCGIFGLNNAKDFVGNVGNTGEPGRGFINIGGKKTEFYASGTDNTYAYAINSSEEVVGEYFDSSNLQHGFYRSASGTITEIAYPGATQTSASGINDAGEITGTYINASNLPYGFTYIKGKYATTDFASTTGINSKGAYVGNYWGVPDGTQSGYLASPQAFTLSTVKVPGNLQAQLWGLNAAGVLVGSYVASDGTSHGLMISDGKVKNIDDPAGSNTICFGINSSNQIVGVYSASSGSQAFEYSAGKFTDIPGPSGAVSSAAFGINDTGQYLWVVQRVFRGHFRVRSHQWQIQNPERTRFRIHPRPRHQQRRHGHGAVGGRGRLPAVFALQRQEIHPDQRSRSRGDPGPRHQHRRRHRLLCVRSLRSRPRCGENRERLLHF